jgi:putative 2-oxoglutarate-Fe(II)-dependent oxygenase superfamily protein
MSHTQRLETHFPVQVLVREHSGLAKTNSDLLALIVALRNEHAGTHLDAVRMRQCTTQGGFQTGASANLFDHPSALIRGFTDTVIKPAVAEYLTSVFGAQPSNVSYRLHGWANVLRAGDWQAPHMHPTEYNIISGVYYVKSALNPEPQGWLEFINPHPMSTMHGDSSSRRHQPLEGQLILFPPYYMHFVHPFKGEGERAVIGFDVRLDPPQA